MSKLDHAPHIPSLSLSPPCPFQATNARRVPLPQRTTSPNVLPLIMIRSYLRTSSSIGTVPKIPKTRKSQFMFFFLAQSLQHPSFLCSWSFRRKWAATFVVSSFTFISPVSSSMIAPATVQAAHDLGVTSNIVIAMMTSVFVAGYGQLHYIGSERRTCFSNSILNPPIDYIYSFWTSRKPTTSFFVRTLMFILNPRCWDR